MRWSTCKAHTGSPSASTYFARLDNLLDKHYATAGFLTSNAFNPNGSFRQPGQLEQRECGLPGAPRAIWGGIRVRLQ